uniref:Uncharacterized protein n=1 Tax=Rhodnius prolixus TaxID=13249 RepID=T1HY46_RHOPR
MAIPVKIIGQRYFIIPVTVHNRPIVLFCFKALVGSSSTSVSDPDPCSVSCLQEHWE